MYINKLISYIRIKCPLIECLDKLENVNKLRLVFALCLIMWYVLWPVSILI